jgi:hypothetical protein
MGVAEAIIIGSVIAGGSAVAASALNKPSKAKFPVNKPGRKVSGDDVTRKGARTALLAGNVQGT